MPCGALVNRVGDLEDRQVHGDQNGTDRAAHEDQHERFEHRGETGHRRIDLVVGIEARGFIFGTPVAGLLDVGFIPIRKPGKLPWETRSVSYDLEYGSDALEIHTDAVAKGERVLVVDDLLATGGTSRAACDLLAGMGAEVVEVAILIELEFLKGRARLAPFEVRSVLKF